MGLKVVQPGRLIHPLADLHKEQQVLSPRFNCPVGPLK